MEGLEGRRLMSTTQYLSDLSPMSATNGLGPVELDRSNGGAPAGDGRAITVGGKRYAKGLGVRAGSTIVYPLGGKYDRFESVVGVDGEVGRKGRVSFRVFLDGRKVYDSGAMAGGRAAKRLSLSVVGKRELQLVAADAGGGKEFDHADWADARLVSTRKLPKPVPAAPAGLTATAASTGEIDLSWVDRVGNERAFAVERSENGTDFSPVASVPANVTGYQDTELAPGTTYYYRVRAANAVGTSAFTAVASATTRSAPPAGDGRPDATNTGPTDEAALKPSESIDVTQDGAVIEDVSVDGTITVNASNVTIRNFRVDAGSADFGISIGADCTNVTIEDGEITGSTIAGIYGPNFTARRLEIDHCGADGIKPWSNVVVDSCYIHHLGMDAGAHADGIQASGGDDITITNNNIDVPQHTEGGQTYLSNSAVFLSTAFGPVGNVEIVGNWLDGGNYTIYSVDGGAGYGSPTGVRIQSNVFGPDATYGTLNVDGPGD